MLIVRRLIKWVLLSLLGLGVFCALYAATAFILPYFPANNTENNAEAGSDHMTIYLITNGVHTDLVMPLQHSLMDWSGVFPLHSIAWPSQPELIAIGWGDREFYLNTPTWADLTASRALGALLGFNESLLHVSLYRQSFLPPDITYPVTLTSEQYQRLVAYVLDSLATPVQQVPGAYGRNDAFFAAIGSYNTFTTCNTWTGDALQAAGVKVSRWTPFANNVLATLEPLSANR